MKFRFSFSSKLALVNWKILNKYNLDLHSALSAQPNSQLSPGSEFKSPNILSNIFSHHPLWNRTKEMLSKGATYPIKPLPSKERKLDLIEGLAYGNHKGVSENKDLFKEMMEEDVINGFSLILP
jgi:hypothetical protein